MTRRVLVHPGAVRDIRNAIAWYDQRSPGLGQLVLTELRRIIDRIRLFPEAYPSLKPGVRHAGLARLPYHAIYAVAGDSITLLAVMHVRRDGQTIEQHLAGRLQP
jgi:plasmid stabilization system protein ParE